MFWPKESVCDIFEQLQKGWDKPTYSVTTEISLERQKGHEIILKLDTASPYFIIMNGKEELFRTNYIREAIERFDEIMNMLE